MRLHALMFFLAAVALPVMAQTTPARRGHITAYGEASVTVRPDLARVSLGVTTTAATANEAASKNADQAAAVIAAVRAALGANADIQTVNYTLGPTYSYPPGGGQPMLTGFTATNIVRATVTDLSLIGRVIDAGIQAGANRVEGISLGLKDEDPVRAQALRAAAQKARSKADTIALGLGVRTGAVISADEGVQVVPRVATGAPTAAATTTPVETGTLEVRATVTLQLEVVQ